MYLEQCERPDEEMRDGANDNVPTERHKAGFVSCVELQKVRQKLALGSKERLLSSFYSGCIPPLRNHMHACTVQLLICGDEVVEMALLHQVTPNAVLLPNNKSAAGVLIQKEISGVQDARSDPSSVLHQIFGEAGKALVSFGFETVGLQRTTGKPLEGFCWNQA